MNIAPDELFILALHCGQAKDAMLCVRADIGRRWALDVMDFGIRILTLE